MFTSDDGEKVNTAMKNKKKGSALPVVLVIVLLIALFIGYRVMKLHWQEFKARAGFTTTIVLIAAVIIILLVLYIRLRIRKARKEKEKRLREEQAEKERLERIAQGLPEKESTLGNGKVEISDVSEIAGKISGKVSGTLKGGDEK